MRAKCRECGDSGMVSVPFSPAFTQCECQLAPPAPPESLAAEGPFYDGMPPTTAVSPVLFTLESS